MTAVNELIERAKAASNADSDNAFVGVLGVTRGAVSNWKRGKAYPDPVTCAKLATITGEPLARVLGIVGEARALSIDEKRVWRRLAAAAAIAVALLPIGTTRAASAVTERSQGIGIMRNVRRLARLLHGLRSLVTERTYAPPALLA